MRKYKFALILVLSMTLLMAACNSDSNIGTQVENTTSVETPNIQKNGENDVIDNEQQLKDFIMKFVRAIKNVDHDSFVNMIGDGGIVSITYFVDNRDPTSVIHVSKDKIRNDLVLENPEHKAGITLEALFAGINEDDLNNMPMNPTNISFNEDWYSKDEDMIEDKLEDIVKTCQQINSINNVYIPQVFLLENNYYAFVLGSGVMEPEVEFTGDWVIFEKTGDKYKILAVIKLQ